MKLFITIFLLIFSYSNIYAAQTYGNADSYNVTIKKIEMCETATIVSETSYSASGCVTLGEATLTVDIASVSVGASLGSYATSTAMIQGRTYRYLVPTLSRTFTVTGGGSFTKISNGTSATCNTDEDASIASNANYLTKRAGKVGGTATAAIDFLNSATSSGIQCLNQDCSDTSTGQTFAHNLPDDTTLYGSSIEVPADNTANFTMIYALTAPFTVGDTVPVITMQFGTASALTINPLRDDDGNDTCTIGSYYPKFRVTVANP